MVTPTSAAPNQQHSSSSQTGSSSSVTNHIRTPQTSGGCDDDCETILIIIFSVLGVLILSFGLVVLWPRQASLEDEVGSSQWERSCQQAKEQVLKDAKETLVNETSLIVSFKKASFSASYIDSIDESNERHLDAKDAKGALSVHPHSSPPGVLSLTNCRFVTGSGVNNAGSFIIVEGQVSLLTGMIYWVEHAPATGIQSLVTGTISPESGTNSLLLSGSFQRSNGSSGTLSRFVVAPEILLQGEEEDLDVEGGKRP